MNDRNGCHNNYSTFLQQDWETDFLFNSVTNKPWCQCADSVGPVPADPDCPLSGPRPWTPQRTPSSGQLTQQQVRQRKNDLTNTHLQ